jgi:DNA-binding GntR family transcriptional regulator
MAAGTSSQKAYDHIRDRILSGDFPPGTVISEAALAKELGLSRTPVGEALRELAATGLVEQVPRYGTIVRSVTRPEIVELYELREALEPYAVGLAAERITAEDIQRLERLCERLDGFLAELQASGQKELKPQALREFLAADMAFHTLLIHAAGNRRIARQIRDSQVLTVLFGTHRLMHDRHVIESVCRFHSRMLAAVRAGDGDTARNAAAEHIRLSLDSTLASFDRQRPGTDLAAMALPSEVREELQRIESHLAPREEKRDPRKGKKKTGR